MKQEQIIRTATRIGNGAHIFVPKEWKGRQIKLIPIEKTPEIKKDVLKLLEPYLEDIKGIYLVGSYSRNEQNKNSDIDIIVVSSKLKKQILSEKYHISIIPLEDIKKTLEKNPILIYPRLMEARTILNNSLLEELEQIKISRNSFAEFIKDTKRILKINKEFIELDKLEGEILISINTIYSLMLRLRGIFIIKCILNKEVYSNERFKKWILKNISDIEYEKIYRIYQEIKENKRLTNSIKIIEAEKLLNLLKKEVKKYE